MKRRSRREKVPVVPGAPVVSAVSTTETEGNAVEIIKAIARSTDGSRIARHFSGPSWCVAHGQGQFVKGSVLHKSSMVSRQITLWLGRKEGLELKTDSHVRGLSLKPVGGTLVLRVPKKTMNASRIKSYANMIAACWLVHGKGWTNGAEAPELVSQPYGREAAPRLPRVVRRPRRRHDRYRLGDIV